MVGRRTFLGAAASIPALLAPRPALAVAPVEPISLPLGVKIAGTGPARVVSAAFLAIHLAEANRVFAPFGVGFHTVGDADLDPRFAALETKEDRDALADEMVGGAINVFYVESLRDVDDPTLHRMGVCWRRLSNLKQRYVIVAANARRATTAHELGHFLGLPHAYVVDNLMSYLRVDEEKIFLDERQGRVVRASAAGLVRKGEVAR